MIFAANLKGQDTINNFYKEGNEIYWQKVYETTMNWQQLYEAIVGAGVLDGLSNENGYITGNMSLVKPDFKGAGFSSLNIPIYLRDYHCSGFVTIESKENKYRVTIKRIYLTQRYEKSLSETNLESFGIKKNNPEFTAHFANTSSKVYDYTFTNHFSFKLAKNDDW